MQPKMPQAHLWPEPIAEEKDYVTVSALIELADGTRKLLWYRLPARFRHCLTTSCDPFIIATIFLFMRQGSDVIIHGEASPSLLKNLVHFQAIWSAWRPQLFHQVQITAEAEREPRVPPGMERAIASFSGGVDSCFTAFRHRRERCGREQRNLEAGLMVHGFDISLKNYTFENAVARSRAMLADLGMECIPVVTNFRELIGLDWEDIFGSGLASCLHLFQGHYHAGVIASSHPYQEKIFDYGSNPLTDRLLSSQSFEIVHDGAFYRRSEKIETILEWPEALKNLRVCWQGKHADRNCGRCEKCVRNILNFRIAGAGLPPCFPQDVGSRQIIATKLTPTSYQIWKALLAKAKAAQINEPWLLAVRTTLVLNAIILHAEAIVPMNAKSFIKHVGRSVKR